MTSERLRGTVHLHWVLLALIRKRDGGTSGDREPREPLPVIGQGRT